MVTALLPIKVFGLTKQRLAPALKPEERCGLAAVMLEDVLDALSASTTLDRVVVLSAERAALDAAARRGFDARIETLPTTHSDAVNGISRELLEGCDRMIALAADLPGLTGEDVDLAVRASETGAVLLPSADGTGTNGVIFAGPQRIPMSYGPGSLERHVGAFRQKACPVNIVNIPGFQLDVDTIADLRALLSSSLRAPRTREFATQYRLESRS